MPTSMSTVRDRRTTAVAVRGVAAVLSTACSDGSCGGTRGDTKSAVGGDIGDWSPGVGDARNV